MSKKLTETAAFIMRTDYNIDILASGKVALIVTPDSQVVLFSRVRSSFEAVIIPSTPITGNKYDVDVNVYRLIQEHGRDLFGPSSNSVSILSSISWSGHTQTDTVTVVNVTFFDVTIASIVLIFLLWILNLTGFSCVKNTGKRISGLTKSERRLKRAQAIFIYGGGSFKGDLKPAHRCKT